MALRRIWQTFVTDVTFFFKTQTIPISLITCEDYVDGEDDGNYEDDGDDEYNDNSDIEMVGCTETIQYEANLR